MLTLPRAKETTLALHHRRQERARPSKLSWEGKWAGVPALLSVSTRVLDSVHTKVKGYGGGPLSSSEREQRTWKSSASAMDPEALPRGNDPSQGKQFRQYSGLFIWATLVIMTRMLLRHTDRQIKTRSRVKEMINRYGHAKWKERTDS